MDFDKGFHKKKNNNNTELYYNIIKPSWKLKKKDSTLKYGIHI